MKSGVAMFIPPKTQAEMSAPHAEGTRHEAMIRVAMSLLGNGMADSAVFAQLRASFPDQDKTDKELQGVIAWCRSKNPSPSLQAHPGLNGGAKNGNGVRHVTPAKPSKTVQEIIGINSIAEKDLSKRSPVGLGGLDEPEAALVLKTLYGPGDHINIVCAYTVNEHGKANPKGSGKTLSRDEWLEYFTKSGVPSSDAGGWIRFNPCLRVGTGQGGAIRDADVTAYRFMLVESDTLSVEQQISFYARLKWPLALVLKSGGLKSVHAWLRLDCKTADEYAETTAKVLEMLKPFGFDQANKNPSRLSRLPGVTRKIGAFGDGRQSVLFIDPHPASILDLSGIERLERQLISTAPKAAPMRQHVQDAIDRYEEAYQNQGARGLMTGMTDFDRQSGGLKLGQMTIVAAQTNVGKSAFAINIANHALLGGKAVALFSLEMDAGEIVDLLVAMNTEVDRTLFNTGKFEKKDFDALVQIMPLISSRRLSIFDDPTLNTKQIRDACLALRDEDSIDLLIVDYAQLVPTDLYRESREQQVANIGRSLKAIAKELKVPLILLSQLNDEGRIRESRALSHDAHIVLVLSQDEKDSKILNLQVAKGRSIKRFDFQLRFIKERGIIKDLEPDPITKPTPKQPYKDSP